MDYNAKQQFLAYVCEMVEKGEVSVAELVAAGTQALENRYEKVNQMRVDAEFALTMVVDLVPKSKHEKHVVAMTKAKKVLVRSGSFEGTVLAQQLAQEIGMVENSK